MSGKPPQNNAHVLLGSSAIKPKERKGLEKFTHLLYDPKEGTILTRTPKSWALITVFYLIYYSCLAGFWYGLLQIFMMNISLDEPRYTLMSSIIGTNPGVGVRPLHHVDHIDTSIYELDLKFDGVAAGSDASTGSLGYASRLKNFLQDYEPGHQHPASVNCSEVDDGEYNKDPNTFCSFDLAKLGECGRFPYGYSPENGRVSPCIILKLNRIWGLKPQPITQEADWPQDSPTGLKAKLTAAGGLDGKRVFMDCQGEYPADKEALQDKITYFPADQGIPLKYFPFQNKEHTQNALLAIQFHDLPAGQLIHIECRAYFKGVVYSRKDKEGMVRFEFLVNPN